MPKIALEVFAGSAVWADSLQKHGFNTTNHCLSTGGDVQRPGYLDEICGWMKSVGVGVVHLGVHCRTWSRANTGAPHRDNGNVEGLESNAGDQLQFVEDGNVHAEITLRIFKFCCRHGIRCSIENQLCSLLWSFREFR